MLTLRTRTNADCAMKNTIQVENAAPCIQRSSGLAGLAWNRLIDRVAEAPHHQSGHHQRHAK